MYGIKGNKKRVCYKCDSRYIGCHSECKEYLEEIKKEKQINEDIFKKKHIYYENDDYIVKKTFKQRNKLKQKDKY